MGMSVLNALFSFIGGLGMFLFGMHIMSEGLQKSAGEKKRRYFQERSRSACWYLFTIPRKNS